MGPITPPPPDVTQFLRESIKHAPLSPDDAADTLFFENNSNLLTTFGNIVGSAANYAQLLSLFTTTPQDVAKAASAASQVTGATAQSVAGAAVAAAAAGPSGWVILAIVAIIAITITLGESDNDPTQAIEQALQKIYEDVEDIKNDVAVLAWQTATTAIAAAVAPVYTDFNTIKIEGITSVNVSGTAFHDHVFDLVSFLILDSPLSVRPSLQTRTFSPPSSSFPGPDLWYWYAPQNGLPNPAQDSNGNPVVPNPMVSLHVWSYAVTSVLSAFALLHALDKNQDNLNQYLSEYQSNIGTWATILNQNYDQAVKGLVKSEVPTEEAIAYYLPPTAATVAWNGVYGVFDNYAIYDQPSFQPPGEVPPALSFYSPSYIIELQLVSSMQNVIYYYTVTQQQPPEYFVVPWIRARVTLGLMARWKALYLLRGYDKVWSILQNLWVLAKQIRPPEPVLPDGTVANGNWSVKEIYKTLVSLFPSDSEFGGTAAGPVSSPPSVIALSKLMYTLNLLSADPTHVSGQLTKPASLRTSINGATMGEGPPPP